MNWNNIKIDYDAFMNRNELCKKYNISPKSITNAIKIGILKKRKIKVTHTNETKQLISKKRTQYLLNNPDKHPWRNNNKFISKPCEELKVFLINNNINFIEEYKGLSNYNYSIDIAFPDKKIGLEINGNQHYNEDGTLKEYYLKRQKIFEQHNWNLIQIHYPLCYNINYKNELLNIILNNKNINNFNYNEYKPILKKKIKKYLNQQDYFKISKENYKEKQEKYIELIKNSDIDFSKFGWVNHVANIIDQKPQKVNIWMKRFMLDHYESKCFKRK